MRITQKIKTILVVWMIALVISACSPAVIQVTTTETSTPTPEQGLPPCGYMWASKSLPDVTAQVQAAFNTAGLKDANVRAEAFGENCLDVDGKVQSFLAMETDFNITMTVPDLTDTQSLGEWLEKMLVVLDQFPHGTVPGPNPGYISVEFTSAQDRVILRFPVTEGISARQQGLHGADLFNDLKEP